MCCLMYLGLSGTLVVPDPVLGQLLRLQTVGMS